MKLSFEASGDQLRVRFGAATLTDEHVLPWDGAVMTALAQKIVGVLRRGNRTRALGDDALSELRFLGEELHRALIPTPVEIDLSRGSGTLTLDLDESLVPLPFELIHDAQGFLCRRYGIGRVVRSRVARRGQERRTLGTPPRALVIAADPRGDLVEVHAESDAIVDALEKEKVRARFLGELDRDILRKELKDYDLVHFAGHADFLPDDPSNSGWHLSSGKLTAADVSELAGGRPMPLVVFSNACESGRTDGWRHDAGEARRAYGLAGAFLYAGVRHYIGTQWEVIDGHSATFATSFYANLASGQAIGSAICHARNAVIESGGEGSLAWASYVLYGDPADRPLKRLTDAKLAMPSPKALAARESAPWKRPTPQTMKRVGKEIAAMRESPKRRRPVSTVRTLLAGASAGLMVALGVGGWLWTHREGSRLAVLPIAKSAGENGVRVESCIATGLAMNHAPIVPTAQLDALAKSTDLAASEDARATSLGAALGARWVLWTQIDGTHASLRVLDVKTSTVVRESTLPLSDLATRCAEETSAIAIALK